MPKLKKVICKYEYLKYAFHYTMVFERDKWTYMKINHKGRVVEKDFTYPAIAENYWRMQELGTYKPRKTFLCKDWCEAECEYKGTNPFALKE